MPTGAGKGSQPFAEDLSPAGIGLNVLLNATLGGWKIGSHAQTLKLECLCVLRSEAALARHFGSDRSQFHPFDIYGVI